MNLQRLAPSWSSLDAGSREKAFWTVSVAVGGFVGYYAIGLRAAPERASTLATSFDRSVPFSPLWMFAYAAVYTAFFLPVFVVRCERLFRRVALGFLFVLFGSYAAFLALPVTTQGFRPDVATLDTRRFVEWGAALNYTLDPPMNCFPSLHVATIVIAALAAWKADRLAGAFGFVVAAVIATSTLFVKQHYAADVLAGAALGVAAYFVCVRGYDPAGKSELEVRYTRLGIVGYVATYVFVVVGVLLPLHLVGWKPWERAKGPLAGVASVGSQGR